MVNFRKTSDGWEVQVGPASDVLTVVGYIDKEGFFTGSLVLKKFIRMSVADLKIIMDRTDEFIRTKN
ncbi:MAG: hypothetical protein Q8P76_01940 [bacterium]|nr:hypothetical protein [bacterium]